MFFPRANLVWSVSMDDAVNVGSVTNIFAKLSLEWNKTPQNLDECGRLLAALKVNAFHAFI